MAERASWPTILWRGVRRRCGRCGARGIFDGYFRLETADYAVLANRIASVDLPTLIVMEGGYAVDALGANVTLFLNGF